MNEQTDRQADTQTDNGMYGWTDKRVDRWIYE